MTETPTRICLQTAAMKARETAWEAAQNAWRMAQNARAAETQLQRAYATGEDIRKASSELRAANQTAWGSAFHASSAAKKAKDAEQAVSVARGRRRAEEQMWLARAHEAEEELRRVKNL